MISVRRVYEPAGAKDGRRFLVDHLWPRGLKKDSVKFEAWLKEVAPSHELRRWFGHDPSRWEEFRRRYFAELGENPEAWQPLLEAAREGPVTLVFGARDFQHNNAVALKSYLEKMLKGGKAGHGKLVAAEF